MEINAFKIGEQVADELHKEMVKRNFGEETAFCALVPDVQTGFDRVEGTRKRLIELGVAKEHIHKVHVSESSITGGFNAATQLPVKHPEVKQWLIFGQNDPAVIGAVRGLEQVGFTHNDVIGVGINGLQCREEFKHQSGFHGSILLQPRRHGYDTVMMMAEWIKTNKQPPELIQTTGIPLTRENYLSVYKEQGIQ